MFDKILLPLDGAPLALRVLKPLERLLRARPVELTLLRVVEPGEAVDERHAAADRDLQVQLREVQARLGAGVDVRVQLVRGDPADEIARHAREGGQDLVAMSTHARTGLDRLVNGSVAERVLHACEVPVLLCSPLAVCADRTARLERILVALDGSERSELVLPLVERVASAHGAEVTLLRVEPFAVSEVPSPALTHLWNPQPVEASLGRAVERLRSAGVKATARAGYGLVATEILRSSDEVDLLALTTHGRSGLPRWWHGSVAEDVLRRARCPLLVVRTPT